jgi:hypothetical protein
MRSLTFFASTITDGASVPPSSCVDGGEGVGVGDLPGAFVVPPRAGVDVDDELGVLIGELLRG